MYSNSEYKYIPILSTTDVTQDQEGITITKDKQKT